MYKNEILNKTITAELEQTELSLIAEMEATNAAIDNAEFEKNEKIRINAEEKEKTQAKNKEAAKIAMDLAVTSIAGLQTLSDLAFASKLSKTKKGSKEEPIPKQITSHNCRRPKSKRLKGPSAIQLTNTTVNREEHSRRPTSERLRSVSVIQLTKITVNRESRKHSRRPKSERLKSTIVMQHTKTTVKREQ